MRPAHVHSRLLGAVLLALIAVRANGGTGDFSYLSPAPGESRVAPANNIAIREGSLLDAASLRPSLIQVRGSRSGAHAGRLRLASDDRTIVFVPDRPFALDELVQVRLGNGMRTREGRALPGAVWLFRVASVDPMRMPPPERGVTRAPRERREAPSWGQGLAIPALASALPCDTLLAGFPPIGLVNRDEPPAEAYFTGPFLVADRTAGYLQILDSFGEPLYQRVLHNGFIVQDFKVQPNGRLTYGLNGPYKFYAMDSAYALVDSFACGNGYPTDLHELVILPNGHALIMSYDPQPVGMDTVVAGGDPNATVYGLVVQELDTNKDVIFQWRSWDHFQITDASVSPLVDLMSNRIDYVHANSIEMSSDGNLIISCRHMNEITKIDRNTGAVIWRMGQHAVHNDWTFVNDPRGFSHAHDARILPNGNMTLFDNGNFLIPLYSRAVEYQLDEEARVATLIWEYRHAQNHYTTFMGNMQRHSDGSTTIGWGGAPNVLNSTDLHPDGSIMAEVQNPSGVISYRSFRFPWRTNRFLSDATEIDIEAPSPGTTSSRLIRVWNQWDQPIEITCLRTTDPRFEAEPLTGTLPATLAPGETLLVVASFSPPPSSFPASSRLYITQVRDDELVAMAVDLHGKIGSSLGVDPLPQVAFGLEVHPNPTRARTTLQVLLPWAGDVTLEILDVAGRRVVGLLDGSRPAGQYLVEWDASGYRPGLYLARIRCSGRTLVRKLVVEG